MHDSRALANSATPGDWSQTHVAPEDLHAAGSRLLRILGLCTSVDLELVFVCQLQATWVQEPCRLYHDSA